MNPRFTCIVLFGTLLLLTSCSRSSFTTVNNMRNIQGTVYLKNGRVVEGEISTSLENSFSRSQSIRFTPRNGGRELRVKIDELEGISLRNEYYVPKLIDEGFFSGDRMLFVKRITRADSRIQMYELHKRRRTNNNDRFGTFTYYVDDYYFYISLPGQEEYKAWSIDGKHMVPNFEDKMSEHVKDCPELAAKIKRKERGYFYAQISLSNRKRIETILNIIDEYNTCR